MPPAAFFRKARIYADADIEEWLVRLLRELRVNVASARDCGYATRDDDFQLQEAERRRRFLLTKNGRDFLNDQRFPMSCLKYGVIVLLGDTANSAPYVEAVRHLVSMVVPFGESFHGMKLTLSASNITMKYRSRDGRILVDRFEVRGSKLEQVA